MSSIQTTSQIIACEEDASIAVLAEKFSLCSLMAETVKRVSAAVVKPVKEFAKLICLPCDFESNAVSGRQENIQKLQIYHRRLEDRFHHLKSNYPFKSVLIRNAVSLNCALLNRDFEWLRKAYSRFIEVGSLDTDSGQLTKQELDHFFQNSINDYLQSETCLYTVRTQGCCFGISLYAAEKRLLGERSWEYIAEKIREGANAKASGLQYLYEFDCDLIEEQACDTVGFDHGSAASMNHALDEGNGSVNANKVSRKAFDHVARFCSLSLERIALGKNYSTIDTRISQIGVLSAGLYLITIVSHVILLEKPVKGGRYCYLLDADTALHKAPKWQLKLLLSNILGRYHIPPKDLRVFKVTPFRNE